MGCILEVALLSVKTTFMVHGTKQHSWLSIVINWMSLPYKIYITQLGYSIT